MKVIRTYEELITFPTFEERFEYLKLDGAVGQETFGFDRHINQSFYKDPEWLRIRNHVIMRDNACDLGIEDRVIYNRILVHHMNPITSKDILERSEFLLDPEYLICVTKNTHDAIHYGNGDNLFKDPIERKPNDTTPWKTGGRL